MHTAWLEADVIGSGTDADPYRPDVGEDAIAWAMAGESGGVALVYVVYPDTTARTGREVVHSETRDDTTARTVSREARTAITSRAATLKIAAFEPDNVYVTVRTDTARSELAKRVR